MILVPLPYKLYGFFCLCLNMENELYKSKSGKSTLILINSFIHYTRNEMGLKLGLKPLFSWFSAVSGGFRGDLDPKTRNLDPA